MLTLPGEKKKQGRTSISDGRLCFACGRSVRVALQQSFWLLPSQVGDKKMPLQ